MRLPLPLALALGLAAPLAACTDSSPEQPLPGLQITSADPAHGIVGTVTNDAGDQVLRFESRIADSVLTTTITNQDGDTVVKFTEDPINRPDLVAMGVPYTTYGDEAFDIAVEEVATGPAGPLLRDLAYGIGEAAPAAALVRERRGLRVPFQSMQFIVGVNPDVQIDDAELHANGEVFTVKGLDHRLILPENWLVPPPAANGDGTQRHSDAEQCFGRCGGGCNDWNDYPTNIQRTYVNTIDIENGGWCNVWNTHADTLHQTCGCKTHGCASHDWCVRELCGGDAFNACSWAVCNIPEPYNPLSWTVVWAGISSISCLWRSDTCWSYTTPGGFDWAEEYQCFYCNESGCCEGSYCQPTGP
ncbi:MAG TPA: hypothetical protein VK698_00510 [Kofleriaceae bacterium]|nr:hypothetical protein [Kofleriaceae bacterium]